MDNLTNKCINLWDNYNNNNMCPLEYAKYIKNYTI